MRVQVYGCIGVYVYIWVYTYIGVQMYGCLGVQVCVCIVAPGCPLRNYRTKTSFNW